MFRTSPLVITALLVSSTALADDSVPVSVMFGAGVTGFADGATRDFVTEGSSWEGRIALNSGKRIEVEFAYVGSLHDIEAFGLVTSAELLGSGLEAAVRLNVLERAVQPYTLAGCGWTRYDLAYSNMSSSDVATHDAVATFPLGVGIGFQVNQVLIDLRATYHFAADAELITPMKAGETMLHTWNGTLRAGFRF